MSRTPRARKTYLDVARGVAVAVMVEAHVVDGWTRDADRHGAAYNDAVFVAGLAAPMFLLLAGVTMGLSAAGRGAREGVAAAARHVMVRGWQVFALAFLFRIQAQLVGWGPLVNLLKVDILNVMGLAIVGAGAMYALAPSRAARLALFTLMATVVTMATPLVRQAAWLDALPDPIESYVRPMPGRTTFALFPWAGFLVAGVVAGDLIAGVKTAAGERRLQWGLAVAAVAGVGLGYAASFMPSIYTESYFWTSSPTFFFIRLGFALAVIPVLWAVENTSRVFAAMATFGRSSLFVYWIHVEMVYGVMGRPLRRLLPLEGSLLATVVLCLLLYVLVLVKNRWMEGVELKGAAKLLAPILQS